MKNYTIAQRNEIYEHLLTLQTPDLLAALIAQRADKNFMIYEASNYTSLMELITDAFIWEETKEGWEFWFEIHECLCAEEYDTPTLSDVIESTEREMFDSVIKVHDVDFESPTEVDFASNASTKAKIEINVDVSKFNQEMGKFHKEFSKEIQPLSFWTRVKLFFGKWGYKV